MLGIGCDGERCSTWATPKRSSRKKNVKKEKSCIRKLMRTEEFYFYLPFSVLFLFVHFLNFILCSHELRRKRMIICYHRPLFIISSSFVIPLSDADIFPFPKGKLYPPWFIKLPPFLPAISLSPTLPTCACAAAAAATACSCSCSW